MTLTAALYRHLPWINLPIGLLIALLQRTPVLRLVSGASEYVVASPVGQVLRAALTAGALGAMHSRAGATTFIISQNSPINGTVGQAITPISFTYSGTPSSPASFQVTGSLPPGLTFTPPPIGATIRSGTPVISGTPTQAGSFTVSVQGFNPQGLTNNVRQPITFVITGAAATVPIISAHPASRMAAAGTSVVFSVIASGTPPLTYQWRKDGANIAGATSSTLTLDNVAPAQAGVYSVVVTNSAGSETSTGATLTVTGGTTPVAISAQPVSQTIAAGSTVVFNVAATGATGFQWRRNNVALAGATDATLVLNNVSLAQAGSYSVVVAGEPAPVTSTAATLNVIGSTSFGRLINLSILTSLATAGEDFTMGYVVGGAGTSGSKPLVIRAAGPSLGAFGVPGTLNDPKVEFFAGATKTGENDNWGGGAPLAAAMAAVGAFPYTSPTTADAAAAVNISTRDNSVKVSAAGSGTGTVIAELYDATPASLFTVATPRLVNVSVLKQIGTGLTAGFVVGPPGQGARTVLIRAIGPTLANFGVGGTVSDPQLTLFGAGGIRLGENDNWGGGAALSAAFSAVGAFALPANSRDAAVLVTLPPGDYTVEVRGVAGATGSALVEVYEVP